MVITIVYVGGNMESKNIKIVDEHGIDRIADIVCPIDVMGSDYIVYVIERDNENDNVFVSKLIKNIDNTSNLMNIEDAMEKESISNLVKELITYAIDNESDKLSSKEIVLNGKKIVVTSALINREQNINVRKTYITTVKKSVSKVAKDFYDVDFSQKEKEETVADIKPIFVVPNISEPKEEVKPEAGPVNTMPIKDIKLDIPNILEPVTSNTSPSVMPVNDEVKLEVPSIDKAVVSEKAKEIPKIVPILPTPLQPLPKKEEVPVMPTPVIPEPVVPEIKPIINPPYPTETPKPSVELPKEDDKLVFDGSKETNLNEALEETDVLKVVPVEDVKPIREFGVDEVKQTNLTTPVEEDKKIETVNTSKSTLKNGGFANNKFFTVIVITFFLAACIFLGYEAFRYFQAVK